jgi:pimeloyl-ACP methyl ester carboxylesterase
MSKWASFRIIFPMILLLTVTAPIGVLADPVPTANTAAINGMEMYYEAIGEGPPMVLLHGFMRSCRAYDPFVKELAGSYQLIIPDLRGHGHSTNPSGKFTMRQSAEDIFALLDLLEIDRIKAIGISAGAVTLLHMATQQPQRIEAMVLIGSGVYYPEACREVLGQYNADTYPPAAWDQLRKIHHRGDEQIRMLFEQLAGFAESYDDVTFTAPHISTIEARTLLVQGDRDYCFPVSMIADVYSSIPHSYLWIIPNGGHVPIYDKWQDSFGKTAMEFFAGDWDKK